MSRRFRIPLFILGGLAGLVLVLVIAALVVLQTGWFRNVVRDRMVAEVEKSTGGRVEIAAFDFDMTELRAVVRGFVLHGTEGPNEPPLFRTDSLEVVLKIVSVFKRDVDIHSLTVERPQVYVRVAQDGSTNIPKPKVQTKSERDPIDTVLNLAVRRFEIRNGLAQFASRKMPLDLRGERLRARLDYDITGPRYTGDISISPVQVRSDPRRPALPVDTRIALKIEKGRIEITRANFDTPQSRLELAGALDDLSAPRGSLRVNGNVVLEEIARTFDTQRSLDLGRAPPLAISAAAALDRNRLNLAGFQLDLGRTRFTASGVIDHLKAMAGSVRFDGSASLAELGRILNVRARPEGMVRLGGDVRLAGLNNYSVDGTLAASNVAFTAGGRRMTDIAASTRVAAKPDVLRLNGMRLAALGGTFNGDATLQEFDAFRLKGELAGFELRELARQYARRELVWDGAISGPVTASGRLKGSPARQLQANVRLGITPGKQGVPIAGRLDVTYDGPRDSIDLGSSHILLPATRLDLAGSIGRQLRIRLVSRNLNDFLPAVALASDNPPKELPVTLQNGRAEFDGTVTGRLSDPAIAGRVALVAFAINQRRFDKFSAEMNAGRNGAEVRNAVLSSGKLAARVEGSVGLRDWKTDPALPVSANASVRNATLRDILALAGREQMRLSGALTAEARVTGTLGAPQAVADVNVSKGTAYDEPFERLDAHVEYTNEAVDLKSALLVANNARVDLGASYRHPPKQFETGSLKFNLTSNGLKLENLRTLKLRQPGLEGTVELRVNGDAAIDNRPGRPRILFSHLDASVNARTPKFGNLVASARTSGQNLLVDFKSDLANSDIRGRANWLLAGDYPIKAEIDFAPVRLGAVRNLMSPSRPGQTEIDGILEGRATVTGPSTRPDELRGELNLAKLEISSPGGEDRPGARAEGLAVRNAAPIRIALDRSTVRISDARFTGPSTNLALNGAVHLKRQDMLDVNVDGSIGLELIERLNPNVFASGSTVLKAAVKGTPSQPVIDGRIELRNASFNSMDLPNGITNANGVVQFSGQQAVIRELTAESGGGKVMLSGFYRFSQPNVFRLRTEAKGVRVRFPPNASTVIDAGLDLNGTAEDSLLSGTVTITDTAYHSNSDFGSMLSQAGTPPRTPEAKTGILAKMRLDVHVETAPAAQFHTTLARNLQAEVDLNVRGTPAQPGLVGRINVTQGEILFFGSKYDISQATVSFFNPQRIEPVLNVDLETQARTIQVFLSVTGSMDNLKLAYRSDPPLPFSDIVRVLATGKAPSTDPVLAAKEPAAPEQSWQQMGASTLLGQAVANPVSGRLQRLFGVTKLKIDPQITGAENEPQARMTMEQQITRNLTFTYIQDLAESNPQVVRVEWAIDPTWSAVAVRQENGQFGVDFYYKKRFK